MLDGTVDGAMWIEACPQEDFDGDGVVAWNDCDDTDPNVLSIGSGVTNLGGPTLQNDIGGWPNSGLRITALQDTVLHSFTFNNQGQSDTIQLMDITTNTQIGSLYVTPTMSAYTVNSNWSLQSGHEYSLTSAGSSNGRWVDYSSYPTQNANISVEGMSDQNQNINTAYWFTFTNLSTEGCN